ncbi:RidA family protein [Cryptosporangium minutisporangium]|uniref:RidA family protein n=1 Tax=Cryptosporangium minutisporangium TaxID=113569 RepID=A0ABP6T9C0_9ACTN
MIETSNPPGVPSFRSAWYSHVSRVPTGAGALLFVSGQVALDDEGALIGAGDVAAQTEPVFQLLGTILTSQNASFDDVVHIRSYLTDLAGLPAYGAVRARYFTGTPPTSTTVEVPRLAWPDALLEVELVAAVAN